VRIRKQGGSGGHKGMTSIIEKLASSDFARTRIGIGRPQERETVDWVLGRFSAEEKDKVAAGIKNAAGAVEKWVEAGIDMAMNAYN